MTIENTTLKRRSFIRSAVMAGGGLILGFGWGTSCTTDKTKTLEITDDWAKFNAFLKIWKDGRITIQSPNPEGGQNVKTAMPMIVAEELDVDWKNVVVEQAPLDTKLFSRQYMGGSNSIRSGWESLRRAGATARQMLRDAAAKTWQVSVDEVTTENGKLYHKISGRSAGYGEMATAAAKVRVPENVKLKKVNDFKIIGKSFKNVDGEKIVAGKPIFGSDIHEEGMLIAMIVHPPAFGLKLKSFDSSSIKTMSGIKDVFSINVLKDNYVREHFDTVAFTELVAIVGNSTWEVMQAKEALVVEWEPIKDHTITRNDYSRGKETVKITSQPESTSEHYGTMAEIAAKPGIVLRKDGDPEKVVENAVKVVECTYTAPFLAHNTMEPMTFFADVTEQKARLKGPLQKPELTARTLSERLGMPLRKIEIDITRMGGGFGRRSYANWVLEAALISKKVNAPVKLLYSREDDMTGGIYRPTYSATYRAALDVNNKMIAYHVKAGGIPSSPLSNPDLYPAGTVDHYLAETWSINSNITEGSYRAPRSNFKAVAEESFLDEIAEVAGKDPIDFRLELLERAQNNPVGERNNYDAKRYAGVLKLLREKSGWNNKQPNVHKGFAAYFSHGSYAAHVLEMKVENGKPITTRVCCVVDCGIVINPDSLKNQIEGSIVDGIGVAMYGQLTFNKGVPDQNNFDSYKLIQFGDAFLPDVIDIHIVHSEENPTGMGEPAFPPVFGALANALYRATGKRFYNQPFINNLETII